MRKPYAPPIWAALGVSGLQLLGNVRRFVRHGQNMLAILSFVVLCAIPLAETASRELRGHSLPGGSSTVQYLTLVITFLGAALAARSNKLLALATTRYLPNNLQRPLRVVSGFITVAVTSMLFLASIELILVDHEYGSIAVWGIPIWIISLVMPIGLAGVAGWVIHISGTTLWERAGIAVALLTPLCLGLLSASVPVTVSWIIGVAILFATVVGMPIFATVGGLAMLLGWLDGSPLSSVAGETYRLATSPLLPAIPLFTLAGFILSAGGSGRRLLQLFQALVGWIPGGLAFVTVGLLAFFTPLTGASGITILAMGGLLLPMLRDAHYPDRTALGLITASGSIGVLLPPSLPVILYAFYSGVPIEQLFIGGLIPGLLLIIAVATWGAARAAMRGAERISFDWGHLRSALWAAKWELAMPVLLLTAMFSGFSTLVETAALTVAYALLVECVIFREISLHKKLPYVVVQSATLVGGFMIILGMALAFTNYLVIAQVPEKVLNVVQAHIHSPWLFLVALNVFLIMVGSLMDIYSAIIVVVPLLIPIVRAYGLDPLHVGIIFMVNMEMGYLTPPVAANLFLAAYRFNRSLPEVFRSTLPYIAILAVVTLTVTYWPQLTLWPVRLLLH